MRSYTRLWLQLTVLAFYKWESLETMFSNHLFDNHLMKVCLAAAFAIGLTACSSSDDPAPADETPPAETMAPEPATPSDLETTRRAAKAAADAAKVASDAADTAADGAEEATANLATLQTGEMAGTHAGDARDAADMAMAEYMKAKAASDAAAEAETASAAGAEKAKAEAAQAAAEDAAKKASDYATEASDAAKMELMIDGTMKSVGDSSVDASMGMLTTTNDDDSKTITGLSDAGQPMHMVAAKDGQAGAQDDPNTDADEAKTPMVSVAAMNVTIGKTLDSSDDTARLMLITKYAGSKMVKVFDYTEDTAALTPGSGGKVQLAGADTPTDDTDDRFADLTYRGMYYHATGGAAANDLQVADTANDGTNASDTVAADPKPKGMRVYSYLDNQGTEDTADDTTEHVVLHSSTTTGGEVSNMYREVDIVVQLPGVPNTAATDDVEHPAKDVSVMADLATPKSYDHIHFGVWASLGEAEDDGSQSIDELGIGFVQSVGDGMTETMPNQKSATYNGDWVAAIQGASEGAISLEYGSAMLEANLDKATLKATLTGLATLSGKIDGSMFSGDKVDVVDGDPHGLNSGGTFSGTFSGGFYGDMAAEAGGVFDFTSKDIADGAFRGAFGGDRMDDE